MPQRGTTLIKNYRKPNDMSLRLNRSLLDAIQDCAPVDGLTHDFYRYPARFSPLFARETIKAFTEPGELVLDPFMGGGTTIVECCNTGRDGIGFDINSLAVFVAKVKTTILPVSQRVELLNWSEDTLANLSMREQVDRPWHWIEKGYQANISSPNTWRLRKALELIESNLHSLSTDKQRSFARCVMLNTAQWAFDCRSQIPSLDQFKVQFRQNIQEMMDGLNEYCQTVQAVRKAGYRSSIKCVNASITDAKNYPTVFKRQPKLIVTSPPYPGVHVLYHRWQVQGRRETKAAYWIANEQDGHFAPYYSFGERRQPGLTDYFDNALKAFTSIADVCSKDTFLVQMIAFSDASWQLEKYLDVMSEAGFKECSVATPSVENGRVWREVPNRKWYAQNISKGANKELVLFHKLR